MPKVGEDLALVDGDPSGSKAAYSASATKDTTTGILVEWAETG